MFNFFKTLLESPQWLLAFACGPLLVYGVILYYREKSNKRGAE